MVEGRVLGLFVGVDDVGRAEQGHITHIGECAHVEDRVVRECDARPEPHSLVRGHPAVGNHVLRWHESEIPVRPLAQCPREFLATLLDECLRIGELFRRGDCGHLVLMFDALIVGVERRRHREDRMTVLHRSDAACTERATVTDPVDLVHDSLGRVSRTEEIAVQGVDLEFRDHGAYCRYQCLPRYLATERPRQQRLRCDAAEDVLFDSFEFEDVFDLRHAGPFRFVPGSRLSAGRRRQGRDGYHPRSASRCGAGISSTLMPTMASPSPRDTLASTSGSS